MKYWQYFERRRKSRKKCDNIEQILLHTSPGRIDQFCLSFRIVEFDKTELHLPKTKKRDNLIKIGNGVRHLFV